MMRRERSTAETTRERLTRNFRKPSSSRRKNDPTDGSSPRARRAFLTLRFRSGRKRRMTSATCGGMTSRYRPIYRRRLCVGRSGSPKTSSKERPWPPAAKYRRLRRICRMSAGSLSTSRVALRRSYSAKFTSTAAGLPLRVTTISSSRSSTPVNSSGRCVFTSEMGRVRPMRLASMSTRILVGEYLDCARRSFPSRFPSQDLDSLEQHVRAGERPLPPDHHRNDAGVEPLLADAKRDGRVGPVQGGRVEPDIVSPPFAEKTEQKQEQTKVQHAGRAHEDPDSLGGTKGEQE